MSLTAQTTAYCVECGEEFLLVTSAGEVDARWFSAADMQTIMLKTCRVCAPCLTRLYGDGDARDA